MDDYQAYLASIIALKKIKSVLEIGCAYGVLTFFLNSICRTDGVDIAKAYIKKAQKLHPGIKFRVADARTMRTKKYDACVTHGFFIHIAPEDIRKTIKNVMRHCKYGIFIESSSPEVKSFNRNVKYDPKRYWNHRSIHPKEDEDLKMKYYYSHDYWMLFEELGYGCQIVKTLDYKTNTKIYYVWKRK